MNMEKFLIYQGWKYTRSITCVCLFVHHLGFELFAGTLTGYALNGKLYEWKVKFRV